ncbi:MAG: hypothetical protein WDA08_02840 [Weeksellaceae bacterium]
MSERIQQFLVEIEVVPTDGFEYRIVNGNFSSFEQEFKLKLFGKTF